MLIPGEWHPDRDGAICPVIRGLVEAADGTWVRTVFLLDTGAATTLLTADVLAELGVEQLPSPVLLGGVGGPVDSVWAKTRISLKRHTGTWITINGPFSAATDPRAAPRSAL